MRNLPFATFGAFIAALGIVCGAFGAHSLQPLLSSKELSLWETAVRYQFIAAFGLLFCERVRTHLRLYTSAGLLFSIGCLGFSGSLYALALGAPRWFGAVTPFGGASLVAAWLLLGLGFRK